MDAILDRLPESEADRVTDVLAGYEGTVRVEAMRKLIAQYESQPPPASGANSAKGASAKGDCGGKGGQSERGQPERGKGRGRGEGGGAAIAVAALRSALPGGGASRPRTAPAPRTEPQRDPAERPQSSSATPQPQAMPKPAPQPTPQSTPKPTPQPTPTTQAQPQAQPPKQQPLKKPSPPAATPALGVAASSEPSVVGTLNAMCSEAEAKEREMCLELSALETLPPGAAPPPPSVVATGGAGNRLEVKRSMDRPRVDISKAVKRYQRPAAGAPPPAARDLRPLPMVLQTVDYLLAVWCDRLEVPALVRYVFLSDRLRAVQQDLTVQRLSCPHVLARIVRFQCAHARHMTRRRHNIAI